MFFTDCHVAEARIVGRPDHAWMQLMAGLNNERLIIAAQALGMVERAFEDTLAYGKERRQFGKTIGSFQTRGRQAHRARGDADDGRIRVRDRVRMERHVRHALVTTISGGTSEIQKEIISRSLGV
jgi:alkylation response protein AidB-like acyl-CoA dehydrogenase